MTFAEVHQCAHGATVVEAIVWYLRGMLLLLAFGVLRLLFRARRRDVVPPGVEGPSPLAVGR